MKKIFITVMALFISAGIMTAQSYTVKFEMNGGNGTDVSKTETAADWTTFFQTFTLSDLAPGNPVYTGYSFDGWLYSGNTYTSNSISSSFTAVTADMTFSAQWTAINHTVKFDANGGTITSPSITEFQVLDGTSVSTVIAPGVSKDGYRFDGWFDKDGNDITGLNSAVTADMTFTAQWTREYKVNFKLDGGTVTGQSGDWTEDVLTGTNIPNPGDPTKPGATFAGWYNGGSKWILPKLVEGDMTLTAQWDEAYIVTFVLDQSDPTLDETKSVKKNTEVTYIPYISGQIFEGWYTDTGLNNEWDSSTPVTQNLKLYAKWESAGSGTIYDVTFVDGSPLMKISVREGSPVTKPADPVKGGSVFGGWYKNGTPWDFSTPVTATMTLSAEWIPPHVVRFDSQGGSLIPSADVYPDGSTPVTKPADPTRPSYVFTGWYKESGCTNEWKFTDPVTADTMILYAGWKVPESGDVPITEEIPAGSGALNIPEVSLPQPAAPGEAGEAPQPVRLKITLPGNVRIFITWYSTNTAIATVGRVGIGTRAAESSLRLPSDEEVEVTPVGAGTAEIIAADDKGTILASCPVTITRNDVGTETVEGKVFLAYPNPASDHITVTGLTAGETVRLYSASGMQVGVYVALSSEQTIDVSTLPGGVYYLKAAGGTVKVIKK